MSDSVVSETGADRETESCSVAKVGHFLVINQFKRRYRLSAKCQTAR